MADKITILITRRHVKFLTSQQKDPVTRKTFIAGDKVTFCSICKLPFLEESWIGIGRIHCGQSFTIALNDLELSSAAQTDTTDSDINHLGSQDQPTKNKTANSTKLQNIPINLIEIPIKLID